ncbi:MAG: AAA domain-containing protein [Bdellovibrionota bacterium]|nr:AAA domain-containing protein [Bdellovibrionota bacterium]
MITQEIKNSILEILAKNNGIKAREIAKIIGCEKQIVNSALYGVLKSQCYQDSSYNWYLKNKRNNIENVETKEEFNSEIANICKYYLNCLSIEESNGISAFLTSKFSPSYAELKSLNVDSNDSNIATLIRKVSKERNLCANMGYPVCIYKIYSAKTSQEYYKIVPLFLFPVDIDGGKISVASTPHVNREIIKRYSSQDINDQIYDLITLEQELGLNEANNEIDIDELVARLQSIREWGWKEKIDPQEIKTEIPVSSFTEEGIYNRAIFIVTEKSPYTIGLESELSSLMRLNESDYRNTALYDWIHNRPVCNTDSSIYDSPFLEVLPMNSEQEQAIRYGFNNELTIVTGPPGTGKSQVVTNLLINATWNRNTVLFTSKNNKAVDVVETRINAIGRRPIMLKIGGKQYAYHLSEMIEDLLSYNADNQDESLYDGYYNVYKDKLAIYNQLKKTKDEIIEQRNKTDHLEQKTQILRSKWHNFFNVISNLDVNNFREIFYNYKAIYNEYEKLQNSFIGKIILFFTSSEKNAQLDNALSKLNSELLKYDFEVYAKNHEALNVYNHNKYLADGTKIQEELRIIAEYKDNLKTLINMPKLEDIDNELIKIKSELSIISKNLWCSWLITRPLHIDADCRKEMNEFVTAIKLAGDIELNDYPEIKKQFNKLQQKMTEFLPCWAVTSLSIKGRVPFKPGIFDLVVIDEASQCDIASVLPILYRAKRAVIIGDQKQLNHISTISKAQDLQLLQKYNVNVSWSYSVNSLYEKASSLCQPNQIIQLRDHHRSFKDIIEFSNIEFYDGRLRIATNYDKLKAPNNFPLGIRWIDAVGESIRPSSGGAYNIEEINCIVNELRKLVLDNDYKGSIGVISPFRSQVEHISKAINSDKDLKMALLNNDFLVDTVHKFQGDEKDLIIFSPVISCGVSQGALEFLRSTGNLFNVAVTRARSVLIVVGNIDYCSKCDIKYMQHFAQYVTSLNNKHKQEPNITQEYYNSREYPSIINQEYVSDWERIFYTALFDNGIKTIPQYEVDKYKLDLAIINDDKKLDIEIDGEMYHKDWSGELSYRDQLRNQRLIELGWSVKRFWVYQIRDDLDNCIKQVKDWCKHNNYAENTVFSDGA